MLQNIRGMLRNVTLIVLAAEIPLLYYGGGGGASQEVILLGFILLVFVSILIAWAY